MMTYAMPEIKIDHAQDVIALPRGRPGALTDLALTLTHVRRKPAG
jgi:hypothetical protein